MRGPSPYYFPCAGATAHWCHPAAAEEESSRNLYSIRCDVPLSCLLTDDARCFLGTMPPPIFSLVSVFGPAKTNNTCSICLEDERRRNTGWGLFPSPCHLFLPRPLGWIWILWGV